jgi:O-acetyl-ADP-ribose deacetylase (regulator of RNase III)
LGIRYLKGDATHPYGPGPKIIAHVCNDVGAWGAGFVLAVSRRWKRPQERYTQWWWRRAWTHESGVSFPLFRLGHVQLVEVEAGSLWVANMLAQQGLASRKQKAGPPLRYEALEQCLAEVARLAQERQASVHMPRIGCGLAGGQWDQVEPLVVRTLVVAGVPVTVYDL